MKEHILNAIFLNTFPLIQNQYFLKGLLQRPTLSVSAEIIDEHNQYNKVPNDYDFSETDDLNYSVSILGTDYSISKNQLIIVPDTHLAYDPVKYKLNPTPQDDYFTVTAEEVNGGSTIVKTIKASGTTFSISFDNIFASDDEQWDFIVTSPTPETIEDTIGSVVVVSAGNYSAAYNVLDGLSTDAVGFPYPIATALLRIFLNKSHNLGNEYKFSSSETCAVTTSEDKLTHKVGVVWNSSQATINRYIYSSIKEPSIKICDFLKEKWIPEVRIISIFDTLRSKAENEVVTLYFSGNDISSGSETEERSIEAGEKYWFEPIGTDLFLAIAQCYIKGKIEITIGDNSGGDTSKLYINSLRIIAEANDIYDFDYHNTELTSGNAAKVQASFGYFTANTIGEAGNIFRTRFLLDKTYNAFSYSK